MNLEKTDSTRVLVRSTERARFFGFAIALTGPFVSWSLSSAAGARLWLERRDAKQFKLSVTNEREPDLGSRYSTSLERIILDDELPGLFEVRSRNSRGK
jgi:hypothetical protein